MATRRRGQLLVVIDRMLHLARVALALRQAVCVGHDPPAVQMHDRPGRHLPGRPIAATKRKVRRILQSVDRTAVSKLHNGGQVAHSDNWMAGEAAVGVGERVDPGDMRALALLHLDRRPDWRLRIERPIRRRAVGSDGGVIRQLRMQLRLRRTIQMRNCAPSAPGVGWISGGT
jgi:hypothetical protein